MFMSNSCPIRRSRTRCELPGGSQRPVTHMPFNFDATSVANYTLGMQLYMPALTEDCYYGQINILDHLL